MKTKQLVKSVLVRVPDLFNKGLSVHEASAELDEYVADGTEDTEDAEWEDRYVPGPR